MWTSKQESTKNSKANGSIKTCTVRIRWRENMTAQNLPWKWKKYVVNKLSWLIVMSVQDSLCCKVLVSNETLVLIERSILDKSVKAFTEKQNSKYFNKNIFCTNYSLYAVQLYQLTLSGLQYGGSFCQKNLAPIPSSESLHLEQNS